ncbi:hypothetical protein ABVK25_009313 [Lepraria finkii]|uniref:Uncharacterized protein n=1 Tax=Lepraria finkii TaxID=1340010 RepID=A0ABR4B0R5_9LECA
MEASPLTLAQSHARKASKANTTTAAIDEHGLAAEQFATAAKGTDDSEAFRTLKLLEQHHQKLAQLLKFQSSHPITQLPETVPEEKPAPQEPSAPTLPKAHAGSPYRPASQSLAAAHRPQRDASSSIASNLASARGIPSNKQRRSGQVSSPVLAQHQAEGKILIPPRRSTTGDVASTTTKSSSEKSPPNPQPSSHPTPPTKQPNPTPEPTQPESLKSDDPFQRFYSTFESLFSKLSAPLAFAGLPLTTDDPPAPEKPASTKKPSKSEELVTTEPDYSRHFSKAALRAVREESGGNNLGAAESFYVVPTTGGMMPYASILARGGHFSGLERDGTGTSEDLEEFVDARETPGPPSPQMIRGGRKVPGSNKTMEELQLENESLRSILDNLSRRLTDFEMGAQASSTALHQSIKASMRQSPEASVGGGGDADGKVALLEELISEGKKELERMRKENEKLKGVVGRYRERWEKLKEGARVRREGTTGKEDWE